jgi:glutamate 5-kinase
MTSAVNTLACPALTTARRVVLKFGSALLTAGGALREPWLASVAADVAARVGAGQQVLVVTSGAVALGRGILDLGSGKLSLPHKQAAAATGQIALAEAWRNALAVHDLTAAQILLTLDDTENRRRHLNARQTLETLLTHRAVPVINENDTVATAEIRYGDNDRLAARVAQMAGADLLVLFSDIDGLYTADPRRDADARHLPEVARLTPEIEAMAGIAPEGISSGGMVTKLMAARIATTAGCAMIIADGRATSPLSRLLDGERHTLFQAMTSPLSARKRWLAGMVAVKGRIVVDAGAERALRTGNSLLPVGVVAVEQEFEKGDPVLIVTRTGQAIAKGLAGYSSDEARLAMGQQSAALAAVPGFSGPEEMLHRDDIVLLEG